MTTIDAFHELDIRVGTVVSAEPNFKARKPALVLKIDFGDDHTKTSSAQLANDYEPEALVGRQIVAVVNLPRRSVAGVESEVLVLAAVEGGMTSLLSPDRVMSNGAVVS